MSDGRSTRIINTGRGARSRAGQIEFVGVVGTADGSSATLTSNIPQSLPFEPTFLCIVGWAWDTPIPGARRSIDPASVTSVQRSDGPCWHEGDLLNCLAGWTNFDEQDSVDEVFMDLDAYPIAMGCPVTKPLGAGTTISWSWSAAAPTGFKGVLVALKFVDCREPATDGWFRVDGDAAVDDCTGGRVTADPYTLDGNNFLNYLEGIRFFFGKTTNITDDSSPPVIFWGHGNVAGSPGTPTTDVPIISGPTVTDSGSWSSLSTGGGSVPFHYECYIGYRVQNGPGSSANIWQWSCPGVSTYAVPPATFFNQWHDRKVYAFSLAHKDTCSCCPRGVIVGDRFKGTTDIERKTGANAGGGSGGLGNWMPGTDEPAQYAAAIAAAAPDLTYPTQGNAIKVLVGLPPDGKQYFGAVAHNGEVDYHDGGAWIWVKYRDPPNAGNTIEVRVG